MLLLTELFLRLVKLKFLTKPDLKRTFPATISASFGKRSYIRVILQVALYDWANNGLAGFGVKTFASYD